MSTHVVRRHARSQIIHIEPRAPAKPETGQTCNGCGVCCALEPCPVGALLSASRRGACAALVWNAPAGRYQCGALVAPQHSVRQALPRSLRGLTRPLAWVLRRWAARWIAVGIGCDSELQIQTGDNAVHVQETAP
jgi:hypothetical protein